LYYKYKWAAFLSTYYTDTYNILVFISHAVKLFSILKILLNRIMALQPALTWTNLLAHYSLAAWTPLLELARTTYAQQGQLLTAAQYLAQPAAAAATPFIDSPEAIQFIANALPAPTEEIAPTYADYAAGGNAQTQPVLRALGDALTAQGIGPAELQAGVASQGATDYLTQVLTPAAWAILAAAAQQQAQYYLDGAGRIARLQSAG
jgi:hypothetical protein